VVVDQDQHDVIGGRCGRAQSKAQIEQLGLDLLDRRRAAQRSVGETQAQRRQQGDA
jgi:hypothetical protein